MAISTSCPPWNRTTSNLRKSGVSPFSAATTSTGMPRHWARRWMAIRLPPSPATFSRDGYRWAMRRGSWSRERLDRGECSAGAGGTGGTGGAGAVDWAGEAVDWAGEAVDWAGEAVDWAGEAVDWNVGATFGTTAVFGADPVASSDFAVLVARARGAGA